MDLIITGGVSANEQSPGIHLLNLFQFPVGSVWRRGVGGVGGGGDCSFLVALINYVTDEFWRCFCLNATLFGLFTLRALNATYCVQETVCALTETCRKITQLSEDIMMHGE